MFGSRVLEEDDEEGGGGEMSPHLLPRPSQSSELPCAPAGMPPSGHAFIAPAALRLSCPPAPWPGAGAFAGASRRVRRLAARGLLRRQALKPGAIISPRDTWPRFDGACA